MKMIKYQIVGNPKGHYKHEQRIVNADSEAHKLINLDVSDNKLCIKF